MEKLNINKIRQLIENRKIRWTNNVLVRLLQRNITQADVENALLNGEIIEEYENDYPYPSCLVYGITLIDKVLHKVCGSNGTELWIITSYYPHSEEWDDNLKIRKEKR